MRYVTGYNCANCNAESTGIEIGDGFRRASGWRFRVPVTNDMRIQCFNCNEDVPRERWQFAEIAPGA